MKVLNDRYIKVFNYKGIDICTLKIACPDDGDSLGYVIDDEHFIDQEFDLFNTAMHEIDLLRRKSLAE